MFSDFTEPHRMASFHAIEVLEYMALNERGGELFKKDFSKILSLE